MSIELIKELRASTGLSFKVIRKALDDAKNDKAKALDILKDHGADVANKKASRETREGVIATYVHSNKKIGVICELLCETDFVARNPLFLELAHELAMQIAAMEPANSEELGEQQYIKDQSLTIAELINDYIAQLGENIRLGSFSRLSL